MAAAEQFISILEQLNESDDIDCVNYCAEYRITPIELGFSLNIEGCGNIALPLSNETLQRMLAVAQPAQFGLREKTIYDKAIRDTSEITADKIQVSYRDDGVKFEAILDEIKTKLGLPADIHLKPHLHNLLIYSKGQFFAQHQDTEKLDGMIATLVMVLPSPHIGGKLIIEHYGKKRTFTSENIVSSDLKLIIFYSDCRHQVKKVLEGHRVVLTYNLVIEQSEAINAKNINMINKHRDALKKSMLEMLEEEVVHASCRVPHIVYFLSHTYTQHGLSWSLLKGSDRLRVEAIKEAAHDADCELLLALLETHEMWTAEYTRSNRYNHDESNPEPDELIESGVSVVHAIDINSKLVQYTQPIRESSIYFHVPNDAFPLFAKQHEGYMGNYGNTIDYWYRRGAVILWRKSDGLVLDFLNDPNSVLSRLVNHSGADVLKLRSQLEKLWPYWSVDTVQHIDVKLLFTLAMLVNDEKIADKILAYCTKENISTAISEPMCQLFSQYGIKWSSKRLSDWLNATTLRHPRQTKKYYEHFSPLIQDLLKHGLDRAVIDILIQYQIECIKASDTHVDVNEPTLFAWSTAGRMELMIHLVKTLQEIGAINLVKEMLDYILLNNKIYPALDLITLLKIIKEPGLYALMKTHILKDLQSEIANGLRNANDWSIALTSSCKCTHCQVLNGFMHARTETHKVWPLKEGLRSHIINVVKVLEAPIDHRVEKKGSPYKLLLTKRTSIHQEAKRRFDEVSQAYQNL